MNVLILNQHFHPDVASSGQYASDLAAYLVERGHAVTVVCGRRAYDDPAHKFSRAEAWRGVRIQRVPSLGLGKASKLQRAADFASVVAAMSARLARLPRFDVVVPMTSPPLLSVLGAAFVRMRGGRLAPWIMDLNPDEAVAAGWLAEGSRPARALEQMLRHSLRDADPIIVLDRFMKQRLAAKGCPRRRIAVIPPWSRDAVVRYDAGGRNEFRRRHGLDGKFVVMYAGNHSPCHPLDTLLGAAERLADVPGIAFCFLGGGSEFSAVRQRALKNATLLPYQPLERLSAALSAADLHAVVMGMPFVGIVHPCKIYNILAVGAPVLYIGPTPSHVTDLLPNAHGYIARHGDAGAAAAAIRRAAQAASRAEIDPALAACFSQQALLAQMAAVLESGARAQGRPPGLPAGAPEVQTRRAAW